MSPLIRAKMSPPIIRAKMSPLIRQFSSTEGAVVVVTKPPPTGKIWKIWKLSQPRLPSKGFLAAGILTVGSICCATAVYREDDVDRIIKSFQIHRQNLQLYLQNLNTSMTVKLKALILSNLMTVYVKGGESYLGIRKMIDLRIKPEEQPVGQERLTLVLDLHETLVFTGWTGHDKGWRTVKRHGVGDFIDQLSEVYEIMVFSDQIGMYVNPIVDQLDPSRRVAYRLSRGDMFVRGRRVKDFSCLKRDLSKVIYVSSVDEDMHRENLVHVQPWRGTPNDTALSDLIPFLKYVAETKPEDVRVEIAAFRDGSRPWEAEPEPEPEPEPEKEKPRRFAWFGRR